MSVVRFDNLWKIYPVGPGVQALRGVSLQIDEGEYVAIMGHSGSGKSTLLNILGCLDKPTKGVYAIGGEEVSTMTDNMLSEVRNRKIGFVFQSFNLIAGLSIIENIEIPLFYQGMPRHQRHQHSTQLAALVGLGDRLHHRPSELSGRQLFDG